MIPPTPTPLGPVPTAPVELPNEFGTLWASTDQPIAMWNQFGQYTIAVQIMVIVLLVIVAVFVIKRIVSSLNSEDNSAPQRVNVTVRAPTYRRSSRRKRR